jgi:hypothetical protein
VAPRRLQQVGRDDHPADGRGDRPDRDEELAGLAPADESGEDERPGEHDAWQPHRHRARPLSGAPRSAAAAGSRSHSLNPLSVVGKMGPIGGDGSALRL